VESCSSQKRRSSASVLNLGIALRFFFRNLSLRFVSRAEITQKRIFRACRVCSAWRQEQAFEHRDLCKRQFGPGRVLHFFHAIHRPMGINSERPSSVRNRKMRKQSSAEGVPTCRTPANADKFNQAPNKTEKKDTPERRSA